jgi:hypothetical protein
VRRIDEFQPDAVFVDVVNIGAGVVDRLFELGYRSGVIEVNGSAKASDGKCFNKRTEMWAKMAKWLERGGAIPDDRDLKEDLCSVEYGYANRSNLLQLERKEEVKKRLGNSPDCADALALTFAEDVVSKKVRLGFIGRQMTAKTDYDVLNYGQ